LQRYNAETAGSQDDDDDEDEDEDEDEDDGESEYEVGLCTLIQVDPWPIAYNLQTHNLNPIK
jgi:hypothetical protein